MKLVQDVWVIMDKNRKAIACGVPRNREMKMFEDCNSRILTYQSEKKAIAGFTSSGFYDRTAKQLDDDPYWGESYLDKTYGTPVRFKGYDGKMHTRYEWDYKEICVAVKAQIIIEVEDEKSTTN